MDDMAKYMINSKARNVAFTIHHSRVAGNETELAARDGACAQNTSGLENASQIYELIITYMWLRRE